MQGKKPSPYPTKISQKQADPQKRHQGNTCGRNGHGGDATPRPVTIIHIETMNQLHALDGNVFRVELRQVVGPAHNETAEISPGNLLGIKPLRRAVTLSVACIETTWFFSSWAKAYTRVRPQSPGLKQFTGCCSGEAKPQYGHASQGIFPPSLLRKAPAWEGASALWT